MKNVLSRIILGIFVAVSTVAAEEPIDIPDPTLKTAIENELQVLDPTPTDMLDLLSLWEYFSDIEDLKGIEYALNLHTLLLPHSNLTDISALQGLASLRSVSVNNSRIKDFSPLSSLSNLEKLDVHNNLISDIEFLSGMTSLKSLTIRHNRISEISILSELINLDRLDMGGNQVEDLSPLLNLADLRSLRIRGNPLTQDTYCNFIPQIVGTNVGMYLDYLSPDHTPTDIDASKGTHDGKVVISWTGVCTGPLYSAYYRVYRVREGDSERMPLGDWDSATSFEDSDVVEGVRYTYSVRVGFSQDGLNPSDFSSSEEGWAAFKPSLTLSSTAGGLS